ncbi:heme ABC exporter ATP-binding protein CcmA [Rhodobacteraceae bacterium CH30]|nr:heme ABC exporter ATP-binding protein CcmA [Rhodobacteraceae bacterium CH30]
MFETIDLGCRKGRRTLFSGLGFSLGAGEVLHLAGSNGCGKTSLLRQIAGFAPLQSGQLRWQGQAVEARSHAWRARLAWCTHQPALKDALSVGENIRTSLRLAGVQLDDDAIRETLAQWQVAEQWPLAARLLSQGQRRRLALASLTLLARPLWLLDEPFNALDDTACRQLWQAIHRHAATGGRVLFTHHAAVAGVRVLALEDFA